MLRFFIFLCLSLQLPVCMAQKVLSESDPIHQKVDRVYKSLCEAAGDFRRDLPRLQIMDRTLRVASYRSSDNTLILELKAYQVCNAFGVDSEAALAFLLGHELTHFYQEHDWGEAGFGTKFLAEINLFSSHQHQEEEADVYGAFIAHIAGYSSLKIVSPLLDRLYEAYKLDVNLDNYPSLSERKKVVTKVESKVKELIKIYDNANYFSALGWQTQAVQCYEYLLQFVKTKELYQNLGAALLSTSIQQIQPAYYYPLEIELGNMLRAHIEKTSAELLQLSIKYFQFAAGFDVAYLPAQLNLAVAHSLLQEFEKAEKHIVNADIYAISVTEKAKVAIIKGILAAQKQEKDKALLYFKTAYNYSINGALREIAQYNEMVLSGTPKNKDREPMSRSEDMIDRIPLSDVHLPSYQQSLTLNSGLLSGAKLHFGSYPSSELSVFEQENQTEQFSNYNMLQRSRKAATKRGVKIGDTADKIRKTYTAIPSRTVQFRDGYFLVYKSLGLIFKINAAEKLEEWALFQSS